MSIIEPFKNELKKYCDDHSLDFNKVLLFQRCGNDKVLFIQRVDKSKVGSGMSNNEPAEILISAVVNDKGQIDITQGENAEKYLKI